MKNYRYDGEHYRVIVEGVTFVKGEVTALSDDELETLKASNFGKAMFESGELVQTDQAQTTSDKKAKTAKAKPKPPEEVISDDGALVPTLEEAGFK